MTYQREGGAAGLSESDGEVLNPMLTVIRVESVVTILGMTHDTLCVPHYPWVIEEFTEIKTATFDAGGHARSAVGMESLPRG